MKVVNPNRGDGLALLAGVLQGRAQEKAQGERNRLMLEQTNNQMRDANMRHIKDMARDVIDAEDRKQQNEFRGKEIEMQKKRLDNETMRLDADKAQRDDTAIANANNLMTTSSEMIQRIGSQDAVSRSNVMLLNKDNSVAYAELASSIAGYPVNPDGTVMEGSTLGINDVDLKQLYSSTAGRSGKSIIGEGKIAESYATELKSSLGRGLDKSDAGDKALIKVIADMVRDIKPGSMEDKELYNEYLWHSDRIRNHDGKTSEGERIASEQFMREHVTETSRGLELVTKRRDATGGGAFNDLSRKLSGVNVDSYMARTGSNKEQIEAQNKSIEGNKLLIDSNRLQLKHATNELSKYVDGRESGVDYKMTPLGDGVLEEQLREEKQLSVAKLDDEEAGSEQVIKDAPAPDRVFETTSEKLKKGMFAKLDDGRLVGKLSELGMLNFKGKTGKSFLESGVIAEVSSGGGGLNVTMNDGGSVKTFTVNAPRKVTGVYATDETAASYEERRSIYDELSALIGTDLQKKETTGSQDANNNQFVNEQFYDDGSGQFDPGWQGAGDEDALNNEMGLLRQPKESEMGGMTNIEKQQLEVNKKGMLSIIDKDGNPRTELKDTTAGERSMMKDAQDKLDIRATQEAANTSGIPAAKASDTKAVVAGKFDEVNETAFYPVPITKMQKDVNNSASLMEAIAMGESGKGDAKWEANNNGHRNSTNTFYEGTYEKDLTKLTVKEVLAGQEGRPPWWTQAAQDNGDWDWYKGPTRDRLFFAVGRIQFVNETLKLAVNWATNNVDGFSLDDKFDQETQVKLEQYLVQRKVKKRLDKYFSGAASVEETIEAMGSEWTSIEHITTTVATTADRMTKRNAFINALEDMRKNASTQAQFKAFKLKQTSRTNNANNAIIP